MNKPKGPRFVQYFVGGKIKVTIGATYTMEKAAGAHRALEKRRASSRSTAIPTKRN
jgi:hypothetical protein